MPIQQQQQPETKLDSAAAVTSTQPQIGSNDCPDLTSNFTSSLTSSFTSSLSSSFTSSVVTTTSIKAPEETKHLNLHNMLTEDNLQALKEQDPFMYRSIPAVHEAKLLFEDVDHSTIAAVSAEPRVQEDRSSNTRRISRRSRISTELHDSLIMEDDLLNDVDFMSFNDE